MDTLAAEIAAQTTVQHFLGTLVKIERGAKVPGRAQWIEVIKGLDSSVADILHQLNAFIAEHPSLWLEKQQDGSATVCQKQITSPRVLLSGRVVNCDLNRIRPYLYYEIASYFDRPEDAIEQAVSLGFFSSREAPQPAPEPTRPPIRPVGLEARREALIAAVRELPEDKLALLERVVDKFQRYSAKELAVAYQHFSLSVGKR